MSSFGGGGANAVRRAFRNLERATAMRKRRRRRKIPENERPVGPKLVRGRGLARRKSDPDAALRWIVYFLLAACALWWLARLCLAPLIL